MTLYSEESQQVLTQGVSPTVKPSNNDFRSNLELTLKNPQQSKWLLGGIVLTFISVLLIGQYWTTTYPSETNPSLQTNPESSSSEQPQLKKTLSSEIISQINNENLEIVTKTISSNFIPDHQEPLQNGYASYSFPAWQVSLTETELQNLLKILPQDNLAKSSSNGLNLSTSEWEVYDYSDVANFWTKDGYACLISSSENGICPPNSQHCPVLPKFIQCAQLAEPEKNNNVVVSTFMNELLSTANISCAASKNCNYQSQILVQAPLYKYSRQVMYSESLGEIAVPEITTQAQQMIQEQEAIFGQAGWQTQQEDYTQTERGWNSSSILSLRLHARNDLHQCLQTITFTSKTTNDVTMRKIVECRVMPQIIGAIE